MTVITRHFLKIPHSGRRVHFRRCGKGPALLMVHQSPRSSAEYESLMRRWGQYFTCIAPDTPGFGQSDPLPGSPEIGEFAIAIVEFVEAAGIQSCLAYGFHSGGIILVSALRHNPTLFSALAIGGYAVWTPEEIKVFGEHYLPEFRPQPFGEHLTWLWNRVVEQSWFFPWFDVGDEARLPSSHVDVPQIDEVVMDMLNAGDAYRVGYGAVLRAAPDIPPLGDKTAPVLITAYEGDPLQRHIQRLGPLPTNWEARTVGSPTEHHAQSLAYLQARVGTECIPAIMEDSGEGWLSLNGGQIHWRGTKGAIRLILHTPAAEALAPGPEEIAIDVPGHGLSSDFDDSVGTIKEAAKSLGAAEIIWPAPPIGDPELLYPDLTPDRYGSHLLRAWSAARAEALFCPWYLADRSNASQIIRAALAPDEIARRARARLRARNAARDWHCTLAALERRTPYRPTPPNERSAPPLV